MNLGSPCIAMLVRWRWPLHWARHAGFHDKMLFSSQSVLKWSTLCFLSIYCIHPKWTPKLNYSVYWSLKRLISQSGIFMAQNPGTVLLEYAFWVEQREGKKGLQTWLLPQSRATHSSPGDLSVFVLTHTWDVLGVTVLVWEPSKQVLRAQSTVTSCSLTHWIKSTLFLSLHLSIPEFHSHVGCAVAPEVDAAPDASGVPWMQRQTKQKGLCQMSGLAPPSIYTSWGHNVSVEAATVYLPHLPPLTSHVRGLPRQFSITNWASRSLILPNLSASEVSGAPTDCAYLTCQPKSQQLPVLKSEWLKNGGPHAALH